MALSTIHSPYYYYLVDIHPSTQSNYYGVERAEPKRTDLDDPLPVLHMRHISHVCADTQR